MKTLQQKTMNTQKESLEKFLKNNPEFKLQPGVEYYSEIKRSWLPWEEKWGYFQDGHYIGEFSGWEEILLSEIRFLGKSNYGENKSFPLLPILFKFEGLPAFQTRPDLA